jgi:hypothetical protein
MFPFLHTGDKPEKAGQKIIDLFNNPVGYFTSLAISRPLGCKIAVF